MSLLLACEHLFPGAVSSGQIKLQDDSDGNGPYISYFDPALGTQPTQAELAAAEIAYRPPSHLDGGEREPTLSEIEQNILGAYRYFKWRVGQKVKAVAQRYGYSQVDRDSKGNFVETGQMEKAAKYAAVQGSPFRAQSNAMLKWESDVWTYLQTRWQAIDPRGDFTGFDGVTPPTWPQLENDIDTNHPEP